MRHGASRLQPTFLLSQSRGVGGDAKPRAALSSFSCQPLQPRHHPDRILKGVAAAMEQADVGFTATHRHSHTDRAAVRVPDDAARRLRREHPDPVRPETVGRGEEDRPPMSSGLLVRDKYERDAAVEWYMN